MRYTDKLVPNKFVVFNNKSKLLGCCCHHQRFSPRFKLGGILIAQFSQLSLMLMFSSKAEI